MWFSGSSDMRSLSVRRAIFNCTAGDDRTQLADEADDLTYFNIRHSQRPQLPRRTRKPSSSDLAIPQSQPAVIERYRSIGVESARLVLRIEAQDRLAERLIGSKPMPAEII